MKLFLEAQSERGKTISKGGQEYIKLNIRDDNKEVIAKIEFRMINDSVGEGIVYDTWFDERLMNAKQKCYCECELSVPHYH